MAIYPDPIQIPLSYEALPTGHIKVSHHPAGSKTATAVVIITLNRPDKRNAFTQQMMEELERVYGILDVDDRVKVVVLTGAGKTFCAGADLEIGFRGGGQGPEHVADHRDGGARVALAIHRCRKPTIAAMQGSAVGVGMTMTLPAVIRLAYQGGKYGFVFARRGITMESCSSYFLPRLVGFSRAMHLVSTGGVYPPTAQHFAELFAETLPDASKVLPRALELATEMAENVSPLASWLNRCLMWRGAESAEEAMLLESKVIHSMFGGKDQKEGVAAFFEKRKPNFTASLDADVPPVVPWWTEADVSRRPKGLKAPAKL